MKKLLLFCDYYLPSVRAGGPVRSIAAIINTLKNDFDITIVTRNHDLCVSTPFSTIESDKLQPKNGYSVLYLSPKKMLSGIYQFLSANNVDIVYFNSFVSPKMAVFPLFLLKLKKIRNTRIIFSPRGELGAGALSIKPIRKKLYINLFKKLFVKSVEFLAASDSEEQEIKKAVGTLSRVTMIANISTVLAAEKIINHKQENSIKIVFISRLSKKKNLLGAIEILSNVAGNVIFDIYGPIEDESYWQTCLAAIKKLPKNIHVIYRGGCDPDQVLTTLLPYDLFFLPTWNENYGHGIVESLASGVPVLLSDQTPWHDLENADAGWECPLSQPTAFSEKIDSLILLNNAEYNQYKIGALNYYKNKILNHGLKKEYIAFFRR